MQDLQFDIQRFAENIYGTSGNDTLKNNIESIAIYGYEGNDTIFNGQDGLNVTIYGGSGNDSIRSYAHYVTVLCGEGDDTVELDFADIVYNYIEGGAGNDSIKSHGRKYATVNGGNDDDKIYDDLGTFNLINGDAGNDYIDADNIGWDTINGSEGNDIIIVRSSYGIGGFNSISGGKGNDKITVQSGVHGENTLNGGEGDDYIYLKHSTKSEYGFLYQYGLNDGNDTIRGFNLLDSIQITSGTYSTSKNGNDFIISVGNGSMILKNIDDYTSITIQDSTGKVSVFNDWSIMSGTEDNDTLSNI